MILLIMNSHSNRSNNFNSNQQQQQSQHNPNQRRQYGNILKIAYWNAAGVANKINELIAFIHLHNIDVMMIMETRTNPSPTTATNRSTLLNINGYHCYFAANPAHFRSGGVATLIKTNIKHMALQPIILKSIQCAPVLINLESGESLILAPVYCPPQPKWNTEHFTKLMDHFYNLGNNSNNKLDRPGLIICGDWNSKHGWWGNPTSCQRGRNLMSAVHNSKTFNVLATGGATHFPYGGKNKPSAIDLAIYSGIEHRRLTTYSTIDLDSDHLPIHIEIKPRNHNYQYNKHQQPLQLQQQQQQQHLRSLNSNSNVKTFHNYLNNRILLNTEINSGQDIEDAIDILVRNIYAAAKVAATSNHLSTRRRRQQQHNQHPIPRQQHLRTGPYAHLGQNENFLRHLEIKRKAKQLHLKIRSATTLKIYKHSQNVLKRIIRAEKTNYYNNLFMQIDPNDRYKNQKLWKINNSIKRQPEANFPLKINDIAGANNSNSNGWTKSSAEKAEIFATHLENRFNPILINSTEDRNKIINDLRNAQQKQQNLHQQQKQQTQQADVTFRPIRHTEVINVIKKLQNNKSPGIDGIDNHTIKVLPLKATLYLVLIFNSMLRLSHFPKQWKCASIKMIPKPV